MRGDMDHKRTWLHGKWMDKPLNKARHDIGRYGSWMERYTLLICRDDWDLRSGCSNVDESIIMTAHILVLSSYGSHDYGI